MHRFAVGLFDKGDGLAVDWPGIAIALFTAGLACADEALTDPNTQTVLRRIHDAAYTRKAGSIDSGTPSAPPSVAKPPLTPGLAPLLDLDR